MKAGFADCRARRPRCSRPPVPYRHRLPQQLGIIAKHLGSEREGVDSGDRSHGQAASLAWDRGQHMIAEEYWTGAGCFGA